MTPNVQVQIVQLPVIDRYSTLSEGETFTC